MITVACVLSDPIREGHREYTTEHVDRLRNMVKAYMRQPFKFVCIDDSGWPGWWAKISLFEPGRFQDRVLYLDLDVSIIGQLDPLVNYPAKFVAVREWLGGGINSSVMAWTPQDRSKIYEQFEDWHMENYRGDQDWISAHMPLAVKFPRNWCPSYKHDVVPNGMPKEAKVVVYHGRPKPWELYKW